MPMKQTNYANRGKSLEDLINYANEQYRQKGAAIIQKVATPWTVIRKGKQIVSAFPAEKSTVDYIGLARGLPVAFDAKQCKDKTRFPLNNIEGHQINFLTQWQIHNGRAFWLIEMVVLQKIFLVEHDQIGFYWAKAMQGGAKSISIKDFENFQEVKQAGGIVLDYLGLYSGGERP